MWYIVTIIILSMNTWMVQYAWEELDIQCEETATASEVPHNEIHFRSSDKTLRFFLWWVQKRKSGEGGLCREEVVTEKEGVWREHRHKENYFKLILWRCMTVFPPHSQPIVTSIPKLERVFRLCQTVQQAISDTHVMVRVVLIKEITVFKNSSGISDVGLQLFC